MYPPRGIRPARGRRWLVTGNKVRSECHCLSHARLSDIEHVNESKGCLRLGLKASSRATLRISHILRGWLRRPIASAGAGASGVSADAGGGGSPRALPIIMWPRIWCDVVILTCVPMCFPFQYTSSYVFICAPQLMKLSDPPYYFCILK